MSPHAFNSFRTFWTSESRDGWFDRWNLLALAERVASPAVRFPGRLDYPSFTIIPAPQLIEVFDQIASHLNSISRELRLFEI